MILIFLTELPIILAQNLFWFSIIPPFLITFYQ